MTMTRDEQALELRQGAFELMWKGEVDEAIVSYDAALAIAESEETIELITIGKAEALLAAEREGAEVQKLPQIVMRRRNPRHVYMAAGVLMRRYNEAEDPKRALFYGEIARNAAAEHGDPFAQASVLNTFGIVLNTDSRFSAAMEVFEQGLVLLAGIEESTPATVTLRATLIGNLGGSKILTNDFDEGVYLINTALPDLKTQYLKAEACADLCLAYMQTDRFQEAEYYGYEALDLACVKRQTRNANHLLGEIMLRTGRHAEAEDFFDVVADFYPQYGNVRQLLMSVDLCAVVNWKGY